MRTLLYSKSTEGFALIEKEYDGSGTCRVLDIHQVPEVAIAFSYDPDEERGNQCVLHKHGRPELVDAWAERTRKAYIQAGFLDIARSIHVISSDKWDVEELNKCLEITDYISTMLEKQGISLQPEKGN